MFQKLPSFRWQSKWFLPVVVLLLVVFAAEMFLSARRESQTFDEPAHLYAGYSYWLHRDYGINPEHPPLVKLVAALPLLLERPADPPTRPFYFRAASAIGGVELLSRPDAQTLLAHSRIAVSAFAFLLGLLIVLSAREMFGQETALFALAIFVFTPMMIANGPLLGTDVGATCFIFGTVYGFYRFVKQQSVARLAVCAVAAGLALASKHSALVIFPFLVLLSVVEIILHQPQAGEGWVRGRLRYAGRLAGAFVVIALVSATILWAFYGFRYAARPDGGQIIPPTAVYLQQLDHPVEAHVIAFAERHHLLPEAYLFGLTDIAILSNQGRVMYLFGKVYPNGRWFYFPAAFVIKMTLGFLLLLLLVPFARVIWRSERRREVLFLIVPSAAYAGVAMMSKLDIGIRHLMPVMPFLFVLTAAGAVSLAGQSRIWAWAVSILLGLNIASSLYAYPNYLPYSNPMFGGPSKTYRVLSDSNAGWGGGLKQLAAYINEHHITKCWLGYSALADPKSFGIPCGQLPTYFAMVKDQGQQQAVPTDMQGPVFLSSEEDIGSFWGSPTMSPFYQYSQMKPSHVVGGEILEFDGNFNTNSIAAASHFVMANTLLRKGKLDAALTNAQEAVALDPNSLYARETLAAVYAADHQPEKAMSEYRAAQQIFSHVDPMFAKDVGPPDDPLKPPHG
jgi:4-amino-4-deoxy-L-arabinose transferase-like glycosyltransferase